MRVSLDHLTWGSSDALFIYEENLDGFFCLGVSKLIQILLVLDVILQNGILIVIRCRLNCNVVDRLNDRDILLQHFCNFS